MHEELEVTHRASNKRGAFLDAKDKDAQARAQHPDLFDSIAHIARVQAVAKIYKNFFNRAPSHYQARGLGRQSNFPFENVKIDEVGFELNKYTMADKQKRLYGPLNALGNVKVNSINGHLETLVYRVK